MRRQSSNGGCRFFQTEMFFRAARPYPVRVVQAATDITQPRFFLILTPACGSRPNLAQVKKLADFHRDAVGFLKSLVCRTDVPRHLFIYARIESEKDAGTTIL